MEEEQFAPLASAYFQTELLKFGFPIIFCLCYIVGLLIVRAKKPFLIIPIFAILIALYDSKSPLPYWLMGWLFSLIAIINPAAGLGSFAISVLLRPFELLPAINDDNLFLRPQIWGTVLGCIRLAVRNRLHFFITRTEIAGFLFLGWCWVSAAFSGNSIAALEFVNDGVSLSVIFCALFVVVCGSAPALVLFRRFFMTGIFGLLCAAILMNFIKPPEAERLTFFGQFGDPNDLIAATIPGLSQAVRWVLGETGFLRFVGVGWIATFGTILFASASRGGFLASGVVAVFEGRHYKMRKYIYVFLALAMAVVGAYSLSQRNTSEMAESAAKRRDILISGVRMAIRNPIFGVGPNQFAEFVQSYNYGGTYIAKKEAHNSWLKCLAETGLVGLFFFVAMFVFALKDALKINEGGVLVGLMICITFLTMTYALVLFFTCLMLSRSKILLGKDSER